MKRLLIVTLFFSLSSGCEKSCLTSVSDSRQPFRINQEKSFQISFGRGSGWHGLDTIAVDQNGLAVLHEITQNGIRRSSFSLPRNDLNAVVSLIDACDIMKLDREYHDESIMDGTQWVLLVQQGENRKSIYFNNHFPKQILNFASRIDTILDTNSKTAETAFVDHDPVSDRLCDAIKL